MKIIKHTDLAGVRWDSIENPTRTTWRLVSSGGQVSHVSLRIQLLWEQQKSNWLINQCSQKFLSTLKTWGDDYHSISWKCWAFLRHLTQVQYLHSIECSIRSRNWPVLVSSVEIITKCYQVNVRYTDKVAVPSPWSLKIRLYTCKNSLVSQRMSGSDERKKLLWYQIVCSCQPGERLLQSFKDVCSDFKNVENIWQSRGSMFFWTLLQKANLSLYLLKLSSELLPIMSKESFLILNFVLSEFCLPCIHRLLCPCWLHR